MKPRTLTPIALILGLGTSIALYPLTQKPTPPAANICEVKTVIDGDTIACADGVKIRLCGIDAPESDQPLGVESKQALANLSQGKKVSYQVVDIDRYGRAIAEISTDKNINAELVKLGLAYHYAQYSSTCPSKDRIVAAEAEAKSRGLGVWGDGRSIKPWDWRKSKSK